MIHILEIKLSHFWLVPTSHVQVNASSNDLVSSTQWMTFKPDVFGNWTYHAAVKGQWETSTIDVRDDEQQQHLESIIVSVNWPVESGLNDGLNDVIT